MYGPLPRRETRIEAKLNTRAGNGNGNWGSAVTREAETQDDMDRGRMGLDLRADDLTTGTE